MFFELNRNPLFVRMMSGILGAAPCILIYRYLLFRVLCFFLLLDSDTVRVIARPPLGLRDRFVAWCVTLVASVIARTVAGAACASSYSQGWAEQEFHDDHILRLCWYRCFQKIT